MVGINYFIYMVFDNTDGKQARRTGSSSPLGMLFDHGLEVVFGSIHRTHVIMHYACSLWTLLPGVYAALITPCYLNFLKGFIWGYV